MDTTPLTTAAKTTISNTTLLYVLIGIGIAILGINLFSIFGSTPPAPNQNLIQYMEAQRKHNDSLETVFTKQAQQYFQAAKAQEQQDSITYIQRQKSLVIFLNQLITEYEKIPSYVGLANDSLRRLFAARFSQ